MVRRCCWTGRRPLLLLLYGPASIPGCSSFTLSPRQARGDIIVGDSGAGCCLFGRSDDDFDGIPPWWDNEGSGTNDSNARKPPADVSDNKNNQDNNNILNPSKKQQVYKRRQGEAASAAMDLPLQPVVTTLKGGSDLLFRMVRQQQQQQQQQQQGIASAVPRWQPPGSGSTSTSATSTASAASPAIPQRQPLSRSSSTSKSLPPVLLPLQARAAAATIWKNARQRNKPSLWRYAIRTYDRLPPSQTTNVHYEGCLVAAAKLGWSEKALSVYETVRARQQQQQQQQQQASSPPQQQLRRSTIHLTDHMMLSLVKACVGDAVRTKNTAILDAVVEILEQRQEDFEQPTTTAAHWNPVAAAYRKLSHHDTARAILDVLPAPRFDGGARRFHLQHVYAKDKGSYAINVSTSVARGDFGRAVLDLKDMTELGMYPETRHLDEWAALSGQ
jgi:hypothetical protein